MHKVFDDDWKGKTLEEYIDKVFKVHWDIFSNDYVSLLESITQYFIQEMEKWEPYSKGDQKTKIIKHYNKHIGRFEWKSGNAIFDYIRKRLKVLKLNLQWCFFKQGVDLRKKYRDRIIREAINLLNTSIFFDEQIINRAINQSNEKYEWRKNEINSELVNRSHSDDKQIYNETKQWPLALHFIYSFVPENVILRQEMHNKYGRIKYYSKTTIEYYYNRMLKILNNLLIKKSANSNEEINNQIQIHIKNIQRLIVEIINLITPDNELNTKKYIKVIYQMKNIPE